tara:strand:+ start:1640 stop:3934 length:2295 start_codon:yes stop_codon:yes gene_type:complete
MVDKIKYYGIPELGGLPREDEDEFGQIHGPGAAEQARYASPQVIQDIKDLDPRTLQKPIESSGISSKDLLKMAEEADNVYETSTNPNVKERALRDTTELSNLLMDEIEFEKREGSPVTTWLQENISDPTQFSGKDQIAKMAMFDFSDELSGAAAATGQTVKEYLPRALDYMAGKKLEDLPEGTIPKEYYKARDKERFKQKQYREANPKKAMAGDAVGSLIGAGPILKAAYGTKGVAPLLSNIFSRSKPLRQPATNVAVGGSAILPQMGKGLLAGGTIAGTQGYGMSEAEDLLSTESFADIGIPAAFGSIVGAGIPLAAPLVQGVFRNKMPLTDLQGEVIRALDDTSPLLARNRINRMGDEGTIMDATQGTQSLARDVRRADPSSATRSIETTLAKRDRNTVDRINEAVEDKLASVNSEWKRRNQQQKIMVQEAKEAYKAAEEAVPVYKSPEVLAHLKHRRIKPIIRDIKAHPKRKPSTILDAQGNKISSMPDSSSEILHLADQTLKTVKAPYINLELNQSFTKALRTENEAYGVAIDTFKKNDKLLEMLDKGKKWKKTNPDEMRDIIENATPEGRQDYLTGIIDEITTRMGDDPTPAVLNKLFGTQKQQDVLSSLFPSKEAFREFTQFINIQKRFKRTRQVVSNVQEVGQPAPKGNFLAALMRNATEQIGDLVAGSKAYALRNFLRGLKGDVTKREFNTELAKILSDQSYNKFNFLTNLDKVAKKQNIKQQTRDLIAQALGAASIGETARQMQPEPLRITIRPR